MSAYRNLGLFLLLAVTWGSAFAGIKIGIQYIPPLLFAALRYDVAAVILFVYVVTTSERIRPSGREEWFNLGVSSLFIITGLQGFLALGEQFTTSAIAAIIVSMGPIITTGLAQLVLPDEGLSSMALLGLLIGFVGVGIVTRPDPDLLLAGELIGEMLVFAAVLSLAAGTVLVRAIGDDVGLAVSVREAWAMGIGAFFLHVSSVILHEPIPHIDLMGPGVGAVLYLAGVPSVVGYFVYFDLLDRLGAIEVNLVLYVTPVVAAVIGWAVLDERLTFVTLVGFGVIFLGFVLLKRKELSALISGPK